MTALDVFIDRLYLHHGFKSVAKNEAISWMKVIREAGHAIVPVEPTETMINAIWDHGDMVWERADGTKWVRWDDIPLAIKIAVQSMDET